MTSSQSSSFQRGLLLVAPAVPYAAVLVGLYAFGSAWVAVLGYHLGIIVVITAARAWSSARVLLRGWSAVTVLALAPVFLAAGAAIYLAWPFVRLDSVDLVPALAEMGLDADSLLFFAWYSVLNPWLEELYWRGYQGSDTRHPTVRDLLFGGYHVLVLVLLVEWPFALLAGVVLSAVGWIWRRLAHRYRGLLVPVATHIVADAAIIAAVYVLSIAD